MDRDEADTLSEHHFLPAKTFEVVAREFLRRVNEIERWPAWRVAQAIFSEIEERRERGEKQNWRGFALERIDASGVDTIAGLKAMATLYPRNSLGQNPRKPTAAAFLLPVEPPETSLRVALSGVGFRMASILISPTANRISVHVDSNFLADPEGLRTDVKQSPTYRAFTESLDEVLQRREGRVKPEPMRIGL